MNNKIIHPYGTEQSIPASDQLNIQVIDVDDADFSIIDEDNNAVMKIADGHIKTGSFDSSTVVTTEMLEQALLNYQNNTDNEG